MLHVFNLRMLARMFKKGQLLLESEPFLHVLAHKSRGKYCDHCLLSVSNPGCEKKLLRCSACSFVRYCDTKCQRKAWSLHKEECKCLKRISPKIPTDSTRLFYHLLLKHKNGELQSVTEKGRDFSQLMSHYEDLLADSKRQEEFMKLCQTINAYTGGELELPSVSETMEIFGKMVINSFSICDPEMQPIGTGVYLLASCLDHLCDPNAVVTFNGSKLQLRLTKDTPRTDVEDLKGVYISYTDSLSCSSDRQKALQDQYYFPCTCSMCTNQNLDNCMKSLTCPNQPCKGHVINNTDDNTFSCDVCGTVTLPDKYDICNQESLYMWTATLEELKQLKAKQEPEAVLICAQTFLSRWDGLLHEDNVYYVRVLDHAGDACIDTSRWKESIEYLNKTLPAYRKYYSQFHPNVGIQLYKIGKMELNLEELESASLHLQQAYRIIEVTHGEDVPFTQGLSEMIHQCHEQMRVQLNQQDT